MDLGLQLFAPDSLPPVARTQTVVTCSPGVSRSPSPEPAERRLPSVLEAAIKAEPKVEVERLPSPGTAAPEEPPARVYVSNTSRQNLETIVEAIRHLEGDHMFGDEPQQQQVSLEVFRKGKIYRDNMCLKKSNYQETPICSRPGYPQKTSSASTTPPDLNTLSAAPAPAGRASGAHHPPYRPKTPAADPGGSGPVRPIRVRDVHRPAPAAVEAERGRR